MTASHVDDFYWYVSSKSSQLYPNVSASFFCADIPYNVLDNGEKEWKVALAQICFPEGLVNVTKNAKVTIMSKKDPSETIQFCIPPKCYATLIEVVTSMNYSISSTPFASKVVVGVSNDRCKIAATDPENDITVNVTEALATMLGFDAADFPSNSVTAKKPYDPLSMIPYVVICSESLLEAAGDSSIKPILRIIPLNSDNLTKCVVYDFVDKCFLPVRADGTSRLCISFRGPNFEEISFTKQLCHTSVFALLNFISIQ